MPGIRENTLEAFAESASHGADGVELDVRLTADGVVVVHHDPVIEGLGAIASLDFKSLPRWVPRLDEVFDACGEVFVNVEVKNDPSEPGFDRSGHLVDAVAAVVSPHAERTMVSCFHRPTLDAYHTVDDAVPTALLTVEVDDAVLDAVGEGGHSGINALHHSLSEDLVRRARSSGLRVGAWTVDDPARMRELAAWGVDIVFTNELDLALVTLRA
jgi:glycerophosphoryl diester phosphodiesterase